MASSRWRGLVSRSSQRPGRNVKKALWQNLWVKTVPPACSSGAQAACPGAGSAKLRWERHIYSQSGRSTTSSVRSGMLRRRSSLPADAALNGAFADGRICAILGPGRPVRASKPGRPGAKRRRARRMMSFSLLTRERGSNITLVHFGPTPVGAPAKFALSFERPRSTPERILGSWIHGTSRRCNSPFLLESTAARTSAAKAQMRRRCGMRIKSSKVVKLVFILSRLIASRLQVRQSDSSYFGHHPPLG